MRPIDAVAAAEVLSEKFNIPLHELVDAFAEIPTVEQMTQMTPRVIVYESPMGRITWKCRKCSTTVGEKDTGIFLDYKDNYCSNCGQRIDWNFKEAGNDR